jgi:hypothetical protein
MKCPKCGYAISEKKIAADLGAKGGRKSRRSLSPEQARAMVEARERTRKEKKDEIV